MIWIEFCIGHDGRANEHIRCLRQAYWASDPSDRLENFIPLRVTNDPLSGLVIRRNRFKIVIAHEANDLSVRIDYIS